MTCKLFGKKISYFLILSAPLVVNCHQIVLMLDVDMRKANFSSGGTFSRYQSNKIRQLLGEETIIHLDYVT